MNPSHPASQGGLRATVGVVLAVSGASLWGVMGIFVRGLSACGYDAYDVAFVRCLIAGVGFLIFLALTQPRMLVVDWGHMAFFCLHGIFAYGIASIAYGVSVARIPISVATVLMFMSPVWVALIGIIVFKEKLRLQTAAIILCCILGAALVSNFFTASTEKMDGLGIAAGILNGFCVALQIMVPRYFAKDYPRDTILVYSFLGAAAAMCFFADFQTIAASFQPSTRAATLFHGLCLGVLCTLFANVAVVKATAYISTTTCSILSSLEVVVGAVAGAVMFHETLSLPQLLGAIIVMAVSLGPALLRRPASGA